jgi:hypothetical protein
MPLVAFALAAAVAASAAGDSLPVAFAAYSHPEITADNCKVKDPGHVTCFTPQKTMGRYVIQAEGTSTATGAKAAQAIAIGGPNWRCGQISTRPGEWASGKRTVVAQCEVTILSDAPFQIDVAFGGVAVTLDPAGPKVVIHSLPWSGVLLTGDIHGGVEQPTAKPAAAQDGPGSSAVAAPAGDR